MAKARHLENLDCGAGALEGMRLALLTRLSEICDCREAALDFTDIKGVHAMRVATRRLRSLVRDCKPYLRRRFPADRLKELADALGAVRDQDVALKKLEELKAKAEGPIADGIDQLLAERRETQELARAALSDVISAEEVQQFSEKFAGRVRRATGAEAEEIDPPHKRAGKQIGPSFQDAGREIILKRFAELAENDAGLCHPGEIEQLHEMRIAAKRLRYAVELFAACWDERLPEFSEEVAELQKSLGELHDLDIWMETLGVRLEKRFAKDRKTHPADRNDSLQSALVWLLGRFAIERAEHYRDALKRWQHWGETELSSRLEKSLQPDDPPPAA